jgi:hypothetical protein
MLAVASARIKTVYRMLLIEPSLYFGVPPDSRRAKRETGKGILPEILCFEIASKFQLIVTPNTLKIAFKNDEPCPEMRFRKRQFS